MDGEHLDEKISYLKGRLSTIVLDVFAGSPDQKNLGTLFLQKKSRREMNVLDLRNTQFNTSRESTPKIFDVLYIYETQQEVSDLTLIKVSDFSLCFVVSTSIEKLRQSQHPKRNGKGVSAASVCMYKCVCENEKQKARGREREACGTRAL